MSFWERTEEELKEMEKTYTETLKIIENEF
jgi:hypothetical protein